jgi:tRNA nucleotidyltransferase/poly(A) polymerase
MARFAAALDFEIEAQVLEAARRSAATLERISAERVLAELERIFGGPRPARAIAILRACELLGRCLPGFEQLRPPDLDLASASDLRLGALERLGPAPGLAAGLCVLLDPSPADPVARPGDFDAATRVLERLKTSRETRRQVRELWRLEREAGALESGALGSRARKLRLVRDAAWPLAARLVAAWTGARGEDPSALRELNDFAASIPREQQFPAALLGPADLAAHSIERGPRWGAILREAEERQLDGRMSTRDEALQWLTERVEGAP